MPLAGDAAASLVAGVTDQIDRDVDCPDPLAKFFAHPVHPFASFVHLFGIASARYRTIEGLLKVVDKFGGNGVLSAHIGIVRYFWGGVNEKHAIVDS